jgi:hypothetical protein
MKRALLIFLIAVLAASGIYASDKTKTKVFRFNDITSISAGYLYEINVTKGNGDKVEVIYPAEMEKYLDINSPEAGTLKFSVINHKNKKNRRNNSEQEDKIIVYMSMSTIRKITLSGISKFNSDDSFKTSDLEIKLSGISTIGNLRISGDNLKIKLSGISKGNIQGTFNNVGVGVNGSSHFNMTGNADNIEANISGISKFTLDGNVKEKSIVKVSGSSKAELKGNGSYIYTSCSGVSKIDAESFHAIKGEAYAFGNSKIEIYTSDEITLKASQLCKIIYYGTPKVLNDLSGKRALIKGDD